MIMRLTDWSNVRVFIGGKELTGVKSVTMNGKTTNTMRRLRRLRTVAEIVLYKHNLN